MDIFKQLANYFYLLGVVELIASVFVIGYYGVEYQNVLYVPTFTWVIAIFFGSMYLLTKNKY